MVVNIPPWHKEEKLREMYVEKGLTITEMADKWGCAHSTVSKWLDEHGIEDPSSTRGVHRWLSPDGYAYIIFYENGESVKVAEHHLSALLNNPSEEVFGEGYVTHHQSKHRADNRPENLETLTNAEHLRLHRHEEMRTVDGWPEL